MSDVSALSHEYQTSAKLAEELNEAIIAIKKARVHHRSGLNQEQRRRLADTLGAVRSRLANNEKAPGEVVPQEVVERLVGRHGSKMAYFLEDLSAAAEVLSGATAPIDEKVVHRGGSDRFLDVSALAQAVNGTRSRTAAARSSRKVPFPGRGIGTDECAF